MGNPVTSGYDTSRPLILDIDLDKVSSGYDPFKNLDKAIDIGIKKGRAELASRMEYKCREYIAEFGYGDSEIYKTVRTKELRDGVVLYVGCDYAIYVEFGTGIVGSENPHPNPSRWQYDVNQHGDEGWWYKTDNPYPNQKVIKTDDGETLAHTRGQESKPFMYKTWLWARRSYTNIIKKNVRKEIKLMLGAK